MISFTSFSMSSTMMTLPNKERRAHPVSKAARKKLNRMLNTPRVIFLIYLPLMESDTYTEGAIALLSRALDR
jgi:hypothetical protein